MNKSKNSYAEEYFNFHESKNMHITNPNSFENKNNFSRETSDNRRGKFYLSNYKKIQMVEDKSHRYYTNESKSFIKPTYDQTNSNATQVSDLPEIVEHRLNRNIFRQVPSTSYFLPSITEVPDFRKMLNFPSNLPTTHTLPNFFEESKHGKLNVIYNNHGYYDSNIMSYTNSYSSNKVHPVHLPNARYHYTNQAYQEIATQRHTYPSVSENKRYDSKVNYIFKSDTPKNNVVYSKLPIYLQKNMQHNFSITHPVSYNNHYQIKKYFSSKKLGSATSYSKNNQNSTPQKDSLTVISDDETMQLSPNTSKKNTLIKSSSHLSSTISSSFYGDMIHGLSIDDKSSDVNSLKSQNITKKNSEISSVVHDEKSKQKGFDKNISSLLCKEEKDISIPMICKKYDSKYISSHTIDKEENSELSDSYLQNHKTCATVTSTSKSDICEHDIANKELLNLNKMPNNNLLLMESLHTSSLSSDMTSNVLDTPATSATDSVYSSQSSVSSFGDVFKSMDKLDNFSKDDQPVIIMNAYPLPNYVSEISFGIDHEEMTKLCTKNSIIAAIRSPSDLENEVFFTANDAESSLSPSNELDKSSNIDESDIYTEIDNCISKSVLIKEKNIYWKDTEIDYNKQNHALLTEYFVETWNNSLKKKSKDCL